MFSVRAWVMVEAKLIVRFSVPVRSRACCRAQYMVGVRLG